MKAFKGFRKDLTCLGFQFRENGINRTEEANCVQNGFHCAENPLDCVALGAGKILEVNYVHNEAVSEPS